MRPWEVILILGSVALFFLFDAQGYPPRNQWTLKPSHEAGKVRFGIERAKEGSRWQSSDDVPLSQFRGLPEGNLERVNQDVKFEFFSDAGKLICEGNIRHGRGSGKFTFVADPNFQAEFERFGYPRPDDEKAFSMLMSGITLEFIKGVRELGLSPSVRELFDLRNHGIALDYIREVKAAGYPEIDVHDLVDLRNHGVKAVYLQELKVAGYNFDPQEVRDLRNHGVKAEFVKSLKDAGYTDLEARQIIELANHGVGAEFIRQSRKAGYNFNHRELIELQNHGVNGAYLERLRASGFGHLTAPQITKLKTHGVE